MAMAKYAQVLESTSPGAICELGEREAFGPLYIKGVDLSKIDLKGADLQGMQFHEVDLRGADLRETDLRLATFRCCDLRGANFDGSRINFARFYRSLLLGATGLPIAADCERRLRDIAKLVLAGKAELSMCKWHSCNTVHCVAGWAIALGGPEGKTLEREYGSEVAGLLLLGPGAHSHFFDSDAGAREWLRAVVHGFSPACVA